MKLSSFNAKMVREKKSEFVGFELHHQLRAISKKVLDTFYQAFSDGKELVVVRLKNGDKLRIDVKNLTIAELSEKVRFEVRRNINA